MKMTIDDKIEVQNVNVPGSINRVNAAKYRAMKKAFLQVLPGTAPGLTQKEIMHKVVDLLPERLFPGGATSGWWMKTVQLDLEAKSLVARESSKPLRWYKH
jgi:hypothetical protein